MDYLDYMEIIFENTVFYCIFNGLRSINKMPFPVLSEIKLLVLKLETMWKNSLKSGFLYIFWDELSFKV